MMALDSGRRDVVPFLRLEEHRITFNTIETLVTFHPRNVESQRRLYRQIDIYVHCHYVSTVYVYIFNNENDKAKEKIPL